MTEPAAGTCHEVPRERLSIVQVPATGGCAVRMTTMCRRRCGRSWNGCASGLDGCGGLAGRRHVVVGRVEGRVRVVVLDFDGLDQHGAELAHERLDDLGDLVVLVGGDRLAHGEDQRAGVRTDAGAQDAALAVVLSGLDPLEGVAGVQRDGDAGLRVLARVLVADDAGCGLHLAGVGRGQGLDERLAAPLGQVVVPVLTAPLEREDHGGSVAAELRLGPGHVLGQFLRGRVGQGEEAVGPQVGAVQVHGDVGVVLLAELDVADHRVTEDTLVLGHDLTPNVARLRTHAGSNPCSESDDT
jgi:hypothetical protein